MTGRGRVEADERAADQPEPGRPGGVVAAHARFGSRAQLLADRRALYALAVELIRGPGAVPRSILDHPVTRFRIGEVLSGRRPPTALRLPTEREIGVDGVRPEPVVVAGPGAERLLEPALRSVAAEVSSPTPVGLVTAADPPAHRRARAQVGAALDLARRLVPELFDDLVGHVALIAVLDPDRSASVVSASSRHMPGLVMVRPGTPVEIAESILHEAAHQRLFDMAMTRDLLRATGDGAPGFRPSWRSTTWPVEQTLAAFHAYACLAELAEAVLGGPEAAELGEHTVLPSAARRAGEIGSWLAAHADLLGADAERLVGAVLGAPEPEPVHRTGPVVRAGAYRAQECRIVSTGDGRCLVGLPGTPPALFWLGGDEAAVLRVLHAAAGPAGLEQLAEGLADQQLTDDVVLGRTLAALTGLVHSELAAPVHSDPQVVGSPIVGIAPDRADPATEM
ncbi:aKG-HExxH-type peptide beta-hydroxylase [Pseudonocardia lacus]|uniref:aKG-HExxH-type peptide beta-hydroxylase n=1 Tax=Pseudonocardia lacus TaxID=2835865 RepID=UPI001BDCB97E|nr:HEXXH motif-containing putative peptide modification protein [Pseudonocardia lacus]